MSNILEAAASIGGISAIILPAFKYLAYVVNYTSMLHKISRAMYFKITKSKKQKKNAKAKMEEFEVRDTFHVSSKSYKFWKHLTCLKCCCKKSL